MKKIRLILIALAVCNLISCGQILGKRLERLQSGTTKVRINLGGNGLNAASVLPGNIMIYAINTAVTRGGATALTDEFDGTTFILPNDAYNFYAVGWTGPNPMEGQAYCGYGNAGSVVTLDGTPTTVNLTLTESNCGFLATTFFADTAGSDGAVTNFDLFSVQACSSMSGTTCGTPNVSFTGSVQVSLDGWSYDNANLGVVNRSIVGACAPFSSGTATTNLAPPIGRFDPGGSSSPNPFQVTVRVFSTSNCTGTVYVQYVFDGGLFNSNHSGTSGIALSGTPNILSILVP